ncbi:MAG TPA: NfeD family protein [Candidatus Binatia bacterium]|nr:NfeD family protein [Candidatus Binatia bacterium]
MTWWWLIWLIAAVVLAAAEIHTQLLIALFLAAGAAAAAIIAGVGLPLGIQVFVGLVVAAAGIVALRPGARRLMAEHRTAPYRFPGMADSLVGLHALTADTVGDERHPGHAILANERWIAVTDSPEPLPSQTDVVVTAVRGTTLLVRASGAPRLT